ncbi:unannotated protein [freshwater metagenome]|uniref:Unannotated protein n=1 Tax=freshwater metagenome TaxID=449393 RepID=A0A6J7R327_9ZZZZ
MSTDITWDPFDVEIDTKGCSSAHGTIRELMGPIPWAAAR